MSTPDMSTPETFTERDEIEMLLPWFVTGRIDAADRTRVETYLAAHPDMRRHIELVRSEQAASIALNEAIAAPATLTVARGMDAVAAGTSLGARQTASSLWQRVREVFSAPTATSVRAGAIAAAVVIALQAATIGTLLTGGGGYTTASGTATEGTTVIVRFTDTASASSIATALAARGMTIVDGPKPGGTFVLRIGPKGLGAVERDRRVAELRQASGVIGLVLP